MASRLHLGDLSGGEETNFEFWSLLSFDLVEGLVEDR